MQLSERADSVVDQLSGGMMRRLSITRSLINRPDLLLLDEPTTGLDPQARHVVWDRLYRLKHDGVTLIITTHYMDEAEQLCDRLGRHGRRADRRHRFATLADRAALDQGGAGVAILAERRRRDKARRDRASANGSRCCRIERWCTRTTVRPHWLMLTTAACSRSSSLVRRSSLEDVFLHLTGRTLVD